MKRAYRFLTRTKRRTVTSTAVLLLVLSGTAYAAFVLEGEGSTTSNETTGSAPTQVVTVTATSQNDLIEPGGAAGPIPITIHNPNTTQAVNINAVTLAVTSTTNAGCTSADFTVTQTPALFNGTTAIPLPGASIPANGTVQDYSSSAGQTTAGATVSLIAAAPAACQSVSINLTETVS